MSDDSRASRPDLSVLRMDPEELEGRRGTGWVVWLLAVIGLVAGGYFALLYFEPPFLLPQVETATVRKETPVQQSTVLTATGYTYARQRAAVGAKIIGRILELPVEEGDRLAEGDLIAVLDSADLEAAVAQSEASLLEAQARRADAEREVARQARLFEAEVTSKAELDAAETAAEVARAQVRLAEARLESARAQLAYTHIYAPIGGVVIEKNVEVGEMVAPGGFTSQQSTGAILRMADPASLEVEADVNESYIARLRPGLPVTIDVDAVPDRAYRGQLRQIVPTADRQRAVVEVKVTIDDRDEHLVPDMSCTVTFLEEGATPEALESEPVIWIPVAAVRGSASAPWALVVEGGVLARRELALGEVDGEEQEAFDGVVPGDRVVVGELGDLEAGDRVRLAGGR